MLHPCMPQTYVQDPNRLSICSSSSSSIGVLNQSQSVHHVQPLRWWAGIYRLGLISAGCHIQAAGNAGWLRKGLKG